MCTGTPSRLVILLPRGNMSGVRATSYRDHGTAAKMGMPLSELGVMQQRSLFRTKEKLPQHWRCNEEGMILPHSYLHWERVRNCSGPSGFSGLSTSEAGSGNVAGCRVHGTRQPVYRNPNSGRRRKSVWPPFSVDGRFAKPVLKKGPRLPGNCGRTVEPTRFPFSAGWC